MDISFIFPGQGSQVVGMGSDFYASSTKAKELFDIASDVMKKDFKKLLFEPNDELNETEFSQPSILLVSAIARELFPRITPKFALGHSLGELSAILSVGAIEFDKAIKLVHKRGLLMKKACEGKNVGMMAVIGIEKDELTFMTKEVQKQGKMIYVANINNSSQIVLAGNKEHLSEFESVLKQNGAKRALLLPMSVASHCEILTSAVDPFGELLQTYLNDTFTTSVISNVTADSYNTKIQAVELLKKQLISPVKYTTCIENAKSDCFVEFGGSVLKGLNRKITQTPTYSITDMKTLEESIKELNL